VRIRNLLHTLHALGMPRFNAPMAAFTDDKHVFADNHLLI